MNQNLLAIDTTVRSLLDSELTPVKDQWLHKDVIIPVGKYEGRKGQVTNIIFFTGMYGIELCMVIQPYKQIRRGTIVTEYTQELLWDHADARSLWPVRKFKQQLTLWSE